MDTGTSHGHTVALTGLSQEYHRRHTQGLDRTFAQLCLDYVIIPYISILRSASLTWQIWKDRHFISNVARAAWPYLFTPRGIHSKVLLASGRSTRCAAWHTQPGGLNPPLHAFSPPTPLSLLPSSLPFSPSFFSSSFLPLLFSFLFLSPPPSPSHPFLVLSFLPHLLSFLLSPFFTLLPFLVWSWF